MPSSRATQRPRFAPDEIDAAGAAHALERARDAGSPLDVPGATELVARTGAAAPAVLSALLAAPELPAVLAREIATRGAIAPAALPPPEAPPDEPIEQTKRRLRLMRHEAMARTALRELYAHADVDRTAREWSHVAAACTAHALAAAQAVFEARDGAPREERTGARVPFVVLGMGKLGGEELNLGSDIDICYFYATDEGAAGERTLNEHFARVGARVADLLGDATELGIAFRVDLRLRPEGSRGPMTNSLASAERYYETWGRSWERAALLRARPVAGDAAFGAALLDALRPFVYRGSVDPGIAVEMAQMLARARREQLADDARDLKLGRGGIREAEFFVQSLQLVWGGRHRSLQVAGTLAAVARLRALGLLSHREARAFDNAWALLRRVEHRVQSMTPYATHLLPAEPAPQRALALSLGYPAYDALLGALAKARAAVRELFATLTPAPAAGALAPASTPPESSEARLADRVAAGADRAELASLARDTLGVRDPEGAADDLLRLSRRADMPLGAVGRERFASLGPRLLAEARDAPDPDRALSYAADLFGRLRGAEGYARRLAASPEKTRGLLGLFGASETLSKTLLARPELLDAVVAGGTGAAPDEDQIRALVDAAVADAARAADAGGGESDPLDAAVGALRRVQREVTLEVGLADMAGVLTPGEVARRLSALAQAVLAQAASLAARETAARFGLPEGAREPLDGVAIFALGSLAARELGYGGDLDVIVLYAREGETRGGARADGTPRPGVTTAEYVARVAQRAIWFLSSPHAAGPGYAVDTRLRPSGSQGTLVVSLESFRRYHGAPGTARGPQPVAAAWERQALIRARLAAGDPVFGATAARAIEQIAYELGPPDARELLRLRERMERELGAERARGVVALKYGRGGVVDVEFATQALQMAHGAAHPDVRTPTTRRALAALRDAGLLDAVTAGTLLAGEQLLRRTLLAARLVTERSALAPDSAATVTVARKLGYRDQGERNAAELLLADLDATRARVRDAFLAVMATLAR